MLTGWLAGGLDAKRVVVIEPMPSSEIAALAAKAFVSIPRPKNRRGRNAGGGGKAAIVSRGRRSAETVRRSATLVVSIMAGATIASISQTCGGAVVRAMPNTPAAIGRGITVAVAAKNVSTAQRAVADALLRATGSVEWVDDESLMDAVTAVSGSGPAYIFLLAEELARAGVEAGLPAELATRWRAKPWPAPANCCAVGGFLRDTAPERHLARRHHAAALEVLMGPTACSS